MNCKTQEEYKAISIKIMLENASLFNGNTNLNEQVLMVLSPKSNLFEVLKDAMQALGVSRNDGFVAAMFSREDALRISANDRVDRLLEVVRINADKNMMAVVVLADGDEIGTCLLKFAEDKQRAYS